MSSGPDPHEVSADDLRYLLAVARVGRLVSAAALLGVDHTTVRRRLDRLEAALGARLLDRGADGWQLTAIGRDVVERAAPLEGLVEQVVAAASGSDAVRGTVRVAAPEGFGSLFAAPALARVRVEHPGIALELVTSTRPLSLRGSGFDLAVTVGSPAGSRVTAELLTEYALRLYAAPSYLAARPAIRTPADLEGHDLVFYVDALLTVRELDLATLGLEGMRLGFGSTNVFAQAEATRAGAGIGLLHAFMGEGAPGLEPVLPRAVDVRLPFMLSTRPDSPAVDAVAIVRDALRREVADRRDELLPPR
ncbi:LysR family transcriptional regulator [Microcella sp.]|uniref:LysR family transcriptional regulator n=1 Tax=Microcella sp. TaxID=1913979 RepID=UPI003F6EED33